MDKRGKLKVFLYSIIAAVFLFGLIFIGNVIAEPPGIDNDANVTEVVFTQDSFSLVVNLTHDPWVYPSNATLQINASLSDTDKNIAVYEDNETLTLTANLNGTEIRGNFTEVNISNSSLLEGRDNTGVQGVYLHWRVYACGENQTDYPAGGANANVTQCEYSNSNSTIFINTEQAVTRTAPVIDLIDPINGSVNTDGNVTFTINMTAGDSFDLTGSNLTIYVNDSLEPSMNVNGVQYDAGVMELNASETISIQGSPTQLQVTFNVTDFNGGSAFLDNRSISYTAFGCNNATTPGNCSFATSNITFDVIFPTFESTVPTITNCNQNNGTVVINNSLSIYCTVSDNTLVDNVTLSLNGTNTSFQYDKDTVTVYTSNDSITDIAAATFNFQFNLSNLITNERWNGVDDFPGAVSSDGFVSFYVEARDNASNAGFSENYTIEFDASAPILSNLVNESITNGTCQTAFVNVTSDEPINVTGYYYDFLDGITANATVEGENSSFNPDLISTVNLTSLISGRRYFYNMTYCDEHTNCNSTAIEGDFTFGWSLCTGWSHYGILNSTLNTSQMATDTGSDFISWWNITDDSFVTYTAASPSLGGGMMLTRGEALLINRNVSGVWLRDDDGN